MRRRPRRVFWSLLAALTLLPPLAARDASAADPPMSAAERRRAHALYDEAEKLVDAERWADALAKLEALVAVNRVTETPVVVFYTGLCKANLGRLRESLTDYKRAREALAADKHMPAKERKLLDDKLATGIGDLEGRIPKVVVHRPAGDADGELHLTLDGAGVEAADVIDKPLPLDPGEHKLSATAPAKKPFEKDFTLTERQTFELTLELESDAPPPKPAPPPPPPPPPPSTGQKTVGYIVLGVGAAALVGGGTHVILDRVVGNKDDNADLVTAAIGGAGVLGVGVGIVLLATAPSSAPKADAAGRAPSPAPGLRFGGGPTPSGASFWLGGSF
jgi:hypothetical protein